MSKRKLLLADDSITIQKVVNLTFADEGIEVISVGDGDSAMRKFDEFIPDLVMADVNMPGLNGYEVCRIIKRTEETQNIPVILLVGSFEPFDEVEAKDAGADDYLTKPFQSIRQLVNKVTDLLNQRERVSETPQSEKPETAPRIVDSFSETLEFEKQEEAPRETEYRREEIGSEFGDAGMDDEMIETSPANDYISDSGSSNQAETSIDYAKTQPLNAEDLKGFNIIPGASAEQEAPESFENREGFTERSEAAPERAEAASFDEEARKLGGNQTYEESAAEEKPENISETEPELDYYLPAGEVEAPEEFEKEVSDAETLEPEVSYQGEEPRTADFSEAPVEEYYEPEPAAEEIRETEEAEEPSSEAEAALAYESLPAEAVETFEPAEQIRSDLTGTPEDEAAPTAAAEETPEAETVAETPISAPVKAMALSFDEGDLLELPPLVEETGIRPSSKIQPVPAEPEPVAAEEAPAGRETETTETGTTEAANAETLSPAQSEAMQAFPPELIEAIAQKVAEQISAKTMNDVLPQITELVMKKMAEENEKNKR